MTDQPNDYVPPSFASVAPAVRTAGAQSWLYLGILVWAAIIFAFLSYISGLVIPLIITFVIGMLFYPLVDRLEARNVGRTAGSLLVMLLLFLVVAGVFYLTIVGVLQQSGQIATNVSAGIRRLVEILFALQLPAGFVGEMQANGVELASPALFGLAHLFSSALSGALALAVGIFMGVFLLFYILSDWHTIHDWLGSHLRLPAELGLTLVDDATQTIRSYYYVLSLSSLVVSISIALTMVFLGLPLALTVGLVTMVTSYIPYIGAIFSGAFAFLVALGSGDLVDALIVLAVVLVMQNVIQTIVNIRLASDKLQIHPLVAFMTTIVGGTVAGVLGAVLAVPIAVIFMNARQRVRAYGWRPPLELSHEAVESPAEHVGVETAVPGRS